MCSPVTNSSAEAVEEWVFPGDGEKRKATFPLFHTRRMDGEHSALSGVERERERLPPIYNSSPPAVRNPPFIFIYYNRAIPVIPFCLLHRKHVSRATGCSADNKAYLKSYKNNKQRLNITGRNVRHQYRVWKRQYMNSGWGFSCMCFKKTNQWEVFRKLVQVQEQHWGLCAHAATFRTDCLSFAV